MGAKRNIDMTVTTDKVKIVKVEDSADDQKAKSDNSTMAVTTEQTPKSTKVKKHRGKRYVTARSVIDKSKSYSPAEAVELIKRASYTKFDGSLVADLLVKEPGELGKLTFPHATGKTVKVAIASEELLKQIEQGQIDFDVLLTTPTFIPKLAKHAKILGPKGLMPNPKNGTITQQPEKVKAELEKGSFVIKTERKAPLAHVVIGNTKMSSQELTANLESLLDVLKFKLVRVYLSSTMSPSVRVKID